MLRPGSPGGTSKLPPPAGSPSSAGLLAALALFLAVSCHDGDIETASRPVDTAGVNASFPRFTDVTGAAAIDFTHENGFDGHHWRIVETINGGVALLDFDGDGLVDVFFANARRLDDASPPPRDALYRNGGDWHFLDVSRNSGLDDPAFSLGCAVADVNGDGRSDLYVTRLGPNRLYLNAGGGRFVDRAGPAGVAGDAMSAGCAFLDMDRDGDLDLYVSTYTRNEKAGFPPAMLHGAPGYWPPVHYAPAPDFLYENLGDGTFRDVSAVSGIRDAPPARSLGVLAADLDGDGATDIYVANDMGANFLLVGDGNGRFVERAIRSGCGLADDGTVLGSMGIDAADHDGDGLVDIFVTNYLSQINNLYVALGPGTFVERSPAAGLHSGNLEEVSWGAAFADLDLDGREDLVVANGDLDAGPRRTGHSGRLEQRARVFRNAGSGRFDETTAIAGDAFALRQVGRGLVAGDLDNDGDLDLVLVNSGGPPRLLRNDGPARGAYALVSLEGSGLNRDAIGARVTIEAGGHLLTRERRSATSYLSAPDPRLHFGLGPARRIDRLEVRWPDGSRTTGRDLPVNRKWTVSQIRNTVGP